MNANAANRKAISTNTQAAEWGFPEAQNELGIRFYVGALVEKNRSAALDWFGKAAAQGSADACYNLGICHAYGQQNEINHAVAVDCFKWAANLGSLEAAELLVKRYASGKQNDADAHEVAQWFRMLCKRDPKALEFKRPVSPECQKEPENWGRRCYWLGIAAEAGVKETQYFQARDDYDSVSYQRTLKSNTRDTEAFDRRARQAVALFRSSSESGFLPSTTCLGDCYMTAFGVGKDVSEAIRLYRLAAEKGYPPAQNALADAYLQGIAGETDLPKALELYEEAAAQGNAKAQYSLGMCYLNGLGVEKDMGKAWMLLTRATHGRVESAYEPHKVVERLVKPQERAKWDEGRRMNPFSRQYSLEDLRKWMYNNNYPLGFVSSSSRNYDWRKMVADLGNPKALCDIGVDLVENPTGDDDWGRAYELFTKTADLGEPAAFFNVGRCLMDGIGVAVDKARGLMWLEKASASGYKSIQPFLADCYCDGIGCEANPESAIAIYRQNMMTLDDRPKEAFLGLARGKSGNGGFFYKFSPATRWIELLAGEGDAESQYEMGLELALYSGRWQKGKESHEAVSWFRKAAEQDHAKAENELGECYRDGQGVEADIAEAIRWFEKAAGHGLPKALFNLAYFYYAGNGVRRDWKKARALLEQATETDKTGLLNWDTEWARELGIFPRRTSPVKSVNGEVGDKGEQASRSVPPDSSRPDGQPWLTKEQILDKLDRTLCLRDKARIQRTSEEDANKCMLCWLGRIISKEIVVEERRNIAPEYCPPSFEWFNHRNPNFPPGTGVLRCGSRKCDNSTMGKGENPDSWKETESRQSGAEHVTLWLGSGPWCEDGAYDIALECWGRITSQPWIDIPDEPIQKENEEWMTLEKNPSGYTVATFHPAAIRHFEWCRQYAGVSLSDYVARQSHVMAWRHGERKPLNLFTDRDNYREGEDGDAAGWNIEFHHEDGRIETFPGVFFPDLREWHKKRKGEWLKVWKRLTWWLELYKVGNFKGETERCARFERWTNAIKDHLEENGPEPEEDIDLDEAIPKGEHDIINQAIGIIAKSLVFRSYAQFVPMGKLEERQNEQGDNPPKNHEEK